MLKPQLKEVVINYELAPEMWLFVCLFLGKKSGWAQVIRAVSVIFVYVMGTPLRYTEAQIDLVPSKRHSVITLRACHRTVAKSFSPTSMSIGGD